MGRLIGEGWALVDDNFANKLRPLGATIKVPYYKHRFKFIRYAVLQVVCMIPRSVLGPESLHSLLLRQLIARTQADEALSLSFQSAYRLGGVEPRYLCEAISLYARVCEWCTRDQSLVDAFEAAWRLGKAPAVRGLLQELASR